MPGIYLYSTRGFQMDTENKTNQTALNTAKKNAAVLEHIEHVVTDIENILDSQPNTPERRIRLKGILFYWLGILFDDGAVDTANLKIALDASRQLTARLKASNQALKGKIKKNLSKDEEI